MRKKLTYYQRCRKEGRCSRYGCRRACQDVDGHQYTKCAAHRKRDAYRIQQVRDSRCESAKKYHEFIQSLEAKKRKKIA